MTPLWLGLGEDPRGLPNEQQYLAGNFTGIGSCLDHLKALTLRLSFSKTSTQDQAHLLGSWRFRSRHTGLLGISRRWIVGRDKPEQWGTFIVHDDDLVMMGVNPAMRGWLMQQMTGIIPYFEHPHSIALGFRYYLALTNLNHNEELILRQCLMADLC